jgi:magnesium chelatase family protein
LFNFLQTEKGLTKTVFLSEGNPPYIADYKNSILDVVGQESAKRALNIAVAGGHNLMLIGSPGTGKSMLAKAVSSILPPLTVYELSEVIKIYSYSGQDLNLKNPKVFRDPHHTISYSGMIGGGQEPQPGEVTLAHKGILFMDEFCEFSRNVLEALRQPMQDRKVTLTRNNVSYTFPCEFSLIAATNPCPCGYSGHLTRPCICTEQKVASYLKKLSGPLADRFDLFVYVYPEDDFINKTSNNDDNSTELEVLRDKIKLARDAQFKRLSGFGISKNADITNKVLKEVCLLNIPAKKLLDSAYKIMGFSPRAYYKVIKVARTIADLGECQDISESHISEALYYRQK